MGLVQKLTAAALLCLQAASAADRRASLTNIFRAGGNVRAASLVGPLPGITSSSYAGWWQVGAPADNAHLFTWYWPALNGNASAPLLVWLQGGPGASSLFALFTEMGPYRLNASLFPVPNPQTWNTEFQMLFVDNPRGTGYSFSNNGTLCTEWLCYASDFDDMLRQFVDAFSLTTNEVFITGESYGGHYVPASAFMVASNNAAGKTPAINLKGIAVGNGFVAPLEMVGGYADIIFNAGLLSPSEYLVAQSYVRNITGKINVEDYVGAYKIWDAFLNGDTTPGGAWYTNVTGLTNYFNVATETSPSFSFYSSYVTSPAVRAALGVGNATYSDGNIDVEVALEGDVMFSQRGRLEALLQQGFQVMVYNGALDLICGAPLTERYINLLNWPGNTFFLEQPKVVWHDTSYPGGAVSGYARSGGNLSFVVMRGAGHMAPFDQPERSLDLITRFVKGAPFN